MFSYRVQSNAFEVSEVKTEVVVKEAEPAVNPESLTTFKINFDEEELEARNTLKLPYERYYTIKLTYVICVKLLFFFYQSGPAMSHRRRAK